MNKTHIIAIAGSLALCAGLTQAGPSSNVAWTVETHTMVRKADPRIGARIETV